MLEQTTRVISENLARAMNRRSFIKRAGGAVFAGVAALASGHMLAGGASANRGPVDQIVGDPECIPPGPYCNSGAGDRSGCHGASCFQHLYNGQLLLCDYMYWYQAGCWTTHVGKGYWVCCDCDCPRPGGGVVSCGCAQYSGSPVPRPDDPGAKA